MIFIIVISKIAINQKSFISLVFVLLYPNPEGLFKSRFYHLWKE
ncbi:MAG: hypothetical protein P8M61_06585 [Crocinitomicaceae bacterium]|nr:hypothetical protein [Crocinitomicaceae bacterium]